MFHGGGWMIGDIPMHRRFYSNIADTTNMVVISPEYRRSPEAAVPLAAYKKGSKLEYPIVSDRTLSLNINNTSTNWEIEPLCNDCMQTIKFVFENAETLGIDKDQIVLSGDSAGGQLTLATGLNAEEELGIRIKAMVPLYPMTQILSTHLTSMKTKNYMITKVVLSFWIYERSCTERHPCTKLFFQAGRCMGIFKLRSIRWQITRPYVGRIGVKN